jgi:hypothetical protein
MNIFLGWKDIFERFRAFDVEAAAETRKAES